MEADGRIKRILKYYKTKIIIINVFLVYIYNISYITYICNNDIYNI